VRKHGGGHPGSPRGGGGLLSLELDWRLISQRRAQPYAIVDPLDELLQMFPQFFKGAVLPGLRLSQLQRVDEALAAAVYSERLGLKRTTLQNKMRRLNISRAITCAIWHAY